METLYRLSYWGLLPCGNELKHTLHQGVLKTRRAAIPPRPRRHVPHSAEAPDLNRARERGRTGPERRKAPCHKGTGLSRNN
ncbi:hypothetical protein, partial [Streptomyces sp. Root1319]